MRKKHNPPPRQPAYNLDEEINTKNYPYYRNIPLKHISDMQHKLLDRYNTLSAVQSVVQSEQPPNQPYNVEYDNSITEYNDSIPEQYIAPLPVFNLIQKPGEYFYSVNIPTPQQSTQYQDIDVNDRKLKEQEEIITANKASIANQLGIIHTQNDTINRNNAYIQQQMYAYTNNLGLIHQQSYTYQTNVSYIAEQEQIIETLKEEIETNQQQLAYHASMLSALNTMLQNPEYFTQLTSMSMNGFVPPDGSNPA